MGLFLQVDFRRISDDISLVNHDNATIMLDGYFVNLDS